MGLAVDCAGCAGGTQNASEARRSVARAPKPPVSFGANCCNTSALFAGSAPDRFSPNEHILSARFTLSVECRLASSHILPGCPPCDRLHGHTWTVRAFWTFTGLDEQGMGANFRDLKQILRSEVHERYDHRHLNDIAPFDSVPPTAENLAREVFRMLTERVIAGVHGGLTRVEVWEGPEACAAYEE